MEPLRGRGERRKGKEWGVRGGGKEEKRRGRGSKRERSEKRETRVWGEEETQKKGEECRGRRVG